MSYRFLENKLTTLALPTDEQGSYGESLAAARLLFATKGEVRWSSRNEDGRKLDIIFSCDHPWAEAYGAQMRLGQTKEILIALIQVKCGNSFAQEQSGGFKIIYSKLQDVYRTAHAITLLWVNPINAKVYWAYLKPHSKNHRIYGAHHALNPCFSFDLARCQIPSAAPKDGLGLIFSPIDLVDGALRKAARKVYKDYTLTAVISPVLGSIKFGQIGWRHMLRRKRKLEYKKQSLRMMPVIKNVLKHVPSSHIIKDTVFKQKNGWEMRYTTHLLEFSKVKVQKPGKTKSEEVQVVLKLIEGISYPINWHINPRIEGNVKREVIFYSCYFRDKK